MTKKKSKKLKSVEKEYQWYKKKVDEMEAERSYDRTWSGKELLVKFKKIKLYLKTQLQKMKDTLEA
jgi:cell fate regulator YaaT (PSP1 superfamily)